MPDYPDDLSKNANLIPPQRILPISSILDETKPVVLMIGFVPRPIYISGSTVTTNPPLMPGQQPLDTFTQWNLQPVTGSTTNEVLIYTTIGGTNLYLYAGNPSSGTVVSLNGFTSTPWKFMRHDLGYTLLGLCITPTGDRCTYGYCIKPDPMNPGQLILGSLPGPTSKDLSVGMSLFNIDPFV